MSEMDRCVFCLGPKRVPIAARCGHTFCLDCFNQFKAYHKCDWVTRCPICRTSLKMNRIVPYNKMIRTQRISIFERPSSSDSTQFGFHIGIHVPQAVSTSSSEANDPSPSANPETSSSNDVPCDSNVASPSVNNRYNTVITSLLGGSFDEVFVERENYIEDTDNNNESDNENVVENTLTNNETSQDTASNETLANDDNLSPDNLSTTDSMELPSDSSPNLSIEINSDDELIEIIDSEYAETSVESDDSNF